MEYQEDKKQKQKQEKQEKKVSLLEQQLADLLVENKETKHHLSLLLKENRKLQQMIYDLERRLSRLEAKLSRL